MNTDSMVERVAKAIESAMSDVIDPYACEDEVTPAAVNAACAAVEAMRSPTEAMIQSALTPSAMPTAFEAARGRSVVRRDYKAMIDAALK